MKSSLEQQYMLFVQHSQYRDCWCSGDFRSQGISRHGIYQISWNIPSPASEELSLPSPTYLYICTPQSCIPVHLYSPVLHTRTPQSCIPVLPSPAYLYSQVLHTHTLQSCIPVLLIGQSLQWCRDSRVVMAISCCHRAVGTEWAMRAAAFPRSRHLHRVVFWRLHLAWTRGALDSLRHCSDDLIDESHHLVWWWAT